MVAFWSSSAPVVVMVNAYSPSALGAPEIGAERVAGVETVGHAFGEAFDFYACGADHGEADSLDFIAKIDHLVERAAVDGDCTHGVEGFLKVIAEVGRLVVAAVLPCYGHAILTVLHQSVDPVVGRDGGREDEQIGFGFLIVENDFLAPVAEKVGLKIGSGFGSVGGACV